MLAPGEIVNETYRVERLLGQGGMASVFLVSHTRLPKRFALKLISHASASPQFIQRFRREAEVLATISHPHIVNVVDWNQTPDGKPYLVMELLEGEDLSSFLQRTGALQKETALSIIFQIGQALQFAHDAGVVHRDLKPGNIFLCKNGSFPNFVKVLDFGIAKVLRDSGFTADQALLGTPAYMSPEQARGQVAAIDHRSDQFSLAIILYEMLSGKQPFCLHPEEDPVAILGHIVAHKPPPLANSTWPALERALRKEPRERFPSIKEFIEALGARKAFNLQANPATFNSTQGEVSSTAKSGSRRKQLFLAGGAVSLLGIVLAATQWMDRTPTPAHLEDPRPTDPSSAPSSEAPIKAGLLPPPAKPLTDEDPAQKPPATSTAPGQDAEHASEKQRPTPSSESGLAKSPKPEKPKPARPPSSEGASQEFSVAVTGATGEQTKVLVACAENELKSLTGMPKSYRIKLERSGALHITDSPPAVYHTDFSACLRNKFAGKDIPALVILSVRGSR